MEGSGEGVGSKQKDAGSTLAKRQERQEDIGLRGRDEENGDRERDVQLREHNMEEDVSIRRMEDVREGEATQRRILRLSVECVIDSWASYEDNIVLGEEETSHVAPQET
ncbi:hypothetical protein DPMN_112765 [Dreissena polymorpha]|uniref:Uncharacterized protein n=1 Tax=Dreissena polymorpha TaxID=45954 RepID=A0A9D4KHF9_DREPO|nr:hypothetical protein DPMN_112765 [Dreissena polymorpha]